VFTDVTDHWSADDFKREIYNEDYIRADPPIPRRGMAVVDSKGAVLRSPGSNA
jgi:hypothetical protein